MSPKRFKVMKEIYIKHGELLNLIIIPAGTVIELEEVEEGNSIEDGKKKWERVIEANSCKTCGGLGRVSDSCPGYGPGNGQYACAVYHSKPCPNCSV